MLKSFKTEIKPTKEQIVKIEKSLGICRFLYNEYIRENIRLYKNGKSFISANEFDKYVNNVLSKTFPWIKECGSKARKQAIRRSEQAFKKFFSKKGGFPNFKKKSHNNMSLYFPKGHKTDWTVKRHRIKIPTLGFVRLKEKGYIPTKLSVISGTITKQADRYYVSVIMDVEYKTKQNNNQGIGIDLGVKEFAICSDNTVYPNINKTKKVKRLEKRLKREQKRLSRKLLKHKKGESTRNIDKQQLKVQKLHQRLSNKRIDYINKVIFSVVKREPSFITIENLNVSGMMKNKHLSKAISKQGFYMFRQKLYNKCKQNNIELRIANRFFPSSKTCCKCGLIKKDLKLKDRVFICECGNNIDRDLNASINLRNTLDYKLA